MFVADPSSVTGASAGLRSSIQKFRSDCGCSGFEKEDQCRPSHEAEPCTGPRIGKTETPAPGERAGFQRSRWVGTATLAVTYKTIWTHLSIIVDSPPGR